MPARRTLLSVLLLALTTVVGGAYWLQTGPGVDMCAAAEKFLGALSEQQRSRCLLDFETPQRLGWHFIPKEERKGVPLKELSEPQQAAALELLRASLSQAGYDKATTILTLESVLRDLEGGDRRRARDPERYFFTIFGQPTPAGRWGLSVEGHHLSLNFVVEQGQVISSTPTFLGANPATVKNATATSIKVGTRVLAKEEQLAFDLLHSLGDDQRRQAVIAEKAPREIRAAGEAQPPQDPPAGLPASQLDREQRKTLRALVTEYANNVPREVADARLQAIAQSGGRNIHFAWAGADQPGVGHYYRIQGPSFLIEFVNTQPDAAGNPANHIHCVWRDMTGDFAINVGS